MIVTRAWIDGALLHRSLDNHQVALAVAVLLGAVLRLVTLGSQSLWVDEGISYWTANRSTLELLERSGSSIRPLYFLVLHPMIVLGGQEWLLRLPSALAGIASLFLLYLIGKELFDRRTGLMAALLLAVSPLHIWYSQEARMYALVSMFVLLALLFALRALRRNSWSDWALFGVFEGLALLTETAAIWFVLSINLAALLMVGYLYRQRRLFRLGVSQVLALLIYLPAIADLFETFEGEHTRWIPPATILAFFRTSADLAGEFMRSGAEGGLVLLLLSVALILGLSKMVGEARDRRPAYLLLLAWLIVPVAVSFLFSQEYFRPALLSDLLEGRKSIFLTRNLITVSFPALLLVSRSLLLSPFRRVSFGILVALVLLGLTGYLGNALLPRKEDYRQAAAITRQYYQPGDLVLASPGYIEQPFAYYFLDPDPAGLPLESLRDGVVLNSGDWQVGAGLEQEDFHVEPVASGISRLRIWLVTTSNPFQEPDDEVMEFLDLHSQRVEVWQLEGVTVQLFNFSTITGAPN